MRKLLPVLPLACLLSGCLGSTRIAPPSFPPVPTPLLTRCLPTPIATQADGSLSSADAERAIRQGDIDLARCDGLRQLAVEAWPR